MIIYEMINVIIDMFIYNHENINVYTFIYIHTYIISCDILDLHVCMFPCWRVDGLQTPKMGIVPENIFKKSDPPHSYQALF